MSLSADMNTHTHSQGPKKSILMVNDGRLWEHNTMHRVWIPLHLESVGNIVTEDPPLIKMSISFELGQNIPYFLHPDSSSVLINNILWLSMFWKEELIEELVQTGDRPSWRESDIYQTASLLHLNNVCLFMTHLQELVVALH